MNHEDTFENTDIKDQAVVLNLPFITFAERPLKDLVTKGVENDELVYDAVDINKRHGDVTKRLIFLMNNHSGENIKHIFIPYDSYSEFDPYQKLYNISFTRSKELNFDGPLIEHYKSLGGYLPVMVNEGGRQIENISLVVAVLNNDDVLLGCV